MNAQGIVSVAVGLVIGAIVFSIPIHEIEVEESYYTTEPHQYQQTLVRERQVIDWPRFWRSVTEAQYLIKNTENTDGTFTLNFLFDNGTDTKTKTQRVRILAGEERAVKMKSTLAGQSTISLNVVPPNRSEVQYRSVKKMVSTWYYLPGLKFLFGW